MASAASPITGSTAQNSSAPTTTAGNSTVNKNIFLQLLVAQLKNQDPMNPTDGTAFVGQLAQFEQLESSVNMEQDISSIKDTLTQLASATSGTNGSTSSTTPNTPTATAPNLSKEN